MKYKQGADVVNRNGDKIGDVERIVLNPQTHEVTHLVVEKGFLFKESKVLPIELVADADENRVVVYDDKLNADDLLNFEEEHYLPAETRDDQQQPIGPLAPMRNYRSPYYYYGPAGTWGGYAGVFAPDEPRYVVHKEQNIPDDTIALETGANVFSQDGEKVGSVEEVITNSSSDRATHMVIAEGWLFKSRKLIPTYWIRATMPGEIHLSVSANYLENLPDYETERS